MSAQRIQRSRGRGWRMPDGAVYVGRPTVWGNPFAFGTRDGLARVPALDGSAWEYEGRVSADGMRHDYHHPDGHVTRHDVRYMTLAECVETFRRALVEPTPQHHLFYPVAAYTRPISGLTPPDPGRRLTISDVRRELVGRDLACWCSLDGPCHADILLEVANSVGDVHLEAIA